MFAQHPQIRHGVLGRALFGRAGRNTALILSWLVIVSISSTASAAALDASDTSLGTSHVLHTTRSVAPVGAIFHGPVAAAGNHYCTASVVNSPGRNLIVTAAHCVSGGTDDLYFAPGYHDGHAPYGMWKLGAATLDPRWTSDQDQDLDVAFVTVEPLDGFQVQNVVGGYTLGIGRSANSTVRITGYPSDDDAPRTCVNRISAFTATQLRIACTAYSSGTSGSPWVTDGTTVMGVIGGYQEGGATDDVSYSVCFDNDIAMLYQRAIAAA
jgi:V8-like Glu-specific endopeptidase